MPRPFVIALVGIDGAGKSTQARWLTEWLTAHGVPSSYLGNPGGRLRMDRIARALGRRNASDLLGRQGFLVLEVVVRWCMVARSVLWTRLSRRTGVMDRYSYCQYVAMRARGDRGESATRTLYSLFPRPDITLFLEVEPVRAQQRIRDRGSDVESLAYLVACDAAYRTLPEAAWFAVIDANRPPPAVRDAVSTTIANRLGLPADGPGHLIGGDPPG